MIHDDVLMYNIARAEPLNMMAENNSKARIRYNCTIHLLITLSYALALSIGNITCTSIAQFNRSIIGS